MGQAWYANSVGKSKDLFCAFCDQWEEGTGTLETEKGEAVEGSENQDENCYHVPSYQDTCLVCEYREDGRMR